MNFYWSLHTNSNLHTKFLEFNSTDPPGRWWDDQFPIIYNSFPYLYTLLNISSVMFLDLQVSSSFIFFFDSLKKKICYRSKSSYIFAVLEQCKHMSHLKSGLFLTYINGFFLYIQQIPLHISQISPHKGYPGKTL